MLHGWLCKCFQHAKAVVSQNGAQELHIVIGNEAGDLDSMSSSISFAFLLSCISQIQTCPVMPVPREQFALRGDAVYAFGLIGVNLENLLFLDDLDLPAVTARSKLHVHLVDHNRLSTELEMLAPFVECIVDHHVDEALYQNCSLDPRFQIRVVDVVGSACTLVYELFHKQGLTELLQAQPELSVLLLSCILLDTSNFDPTVRKGTPRDLLAAQALSNICQKYLLECPQRTDLDFSSSASFESSLFKTLLAHRTDISRLTTRQLLLKDAKFGRSNSCSFVICSVPLGINAWLARYPDMHREILAFAQQKQLQLIIVMTLFSNPEEEKESLKRELLFCGPPHLLQALSKALASPFQLEPAPFCVSELADLQFTRYSQADISKSRKQLMLVVLSVR